jgi:hypothetical protein
MLPHRVRRLVVTRVPLDRGILNTLIVAGWIATLQTGDLELSWVAPSRYSRAGVPRNTRIWSRGMIKASTTRLIRGVKALFEQ